MNLPTRVNFILPFPTKRPNGGPKIMYTYANLLAEKGYNVQIYHSLNTSYTKYKKPYFIRAILHKLRKTSQPKWFELHKKKLNLLTLSVFQTNLFPMPISSFLNGGPQLWKLID